MSYTRNPNRKHISLWLPVDDLAKAQTLIAQLNARRKTHRVVMSGFVIDLIHEAVKDVKPSAEALRAAQAQVRKNERINREQASKGPSPERREKDMCYHMRAHWKRRMEKFARDLAAARKAGLSGAECAQIEGRLEQVTEKYNAECRHWERLYGKIAR